MTGTVRHTRRHERKSLPMLVQYRFNPIGEFHTDYSVNISAGGLLLHMVTAPQIGATVHLQFIMRGEARVITCRGRVLRVEQSNMPEAPVRAAVQFVDIDEDDFVALTELVKQNAEAQAKTPPKKRASR
ncbi:MAG: PilZ domain-containing protein [Deltaproteobacteria bacterium]|nr:PilZ domain-containing protein [Deltaproteobacteria bacterium]